MRHVVCGASVDRVGESMSALAASVEFEQQQAARREEIANKKQALKDKQLLHAKEYPLSRADVKNIAKGASRDAMLIASEGSDADAQRAGFLTLCEGLGVTYPDSDYGQPCEVARLKDVGWWGRKIRVAAWREYETRQLRLGLVKQFVSDDIARARRWHREAIAQMLERLMAIRDDEQAVMTVADLMRSSVSHLPNRRAEMIVRFKGVAQRCADKGWTYTFITLTAPSKYHRLRTRRESFGIKRLVDNPRWAEAGGPTPRDTQQYHNKTYSRIRAELARQKIGFAALRTVEPHADGTPHWHLAVFCAPDQLAALKAVFQKHALREDGDENGAAEHRYTAKDYNPADGDMVDRCIAYLITYVAKNIDGHGVLMATDDGGEAGGAAPVCEAIEGARRVEAWATLWGIRQFQIAGGGTVTGYRELRRLREPIPDDAAAESLRLSTNASDYAAYLAGAEVEQLSLWSDSAVEKLQRAAVAEGVDPGAVSNELADILLEQKILNRWGEPLRHFVYGVVVDGRHILTRPHTWRVADSAEVERVAHGKAVGAFYAAAATIQTPGGWHTRATDDGIAVALALAPGFCFSSAARRRALGPVSVTVRAGDPPAARRFPRLCEGVEHENHESDIEERYQPYRR